MKINQNKMTILSMIAVVASAILVNEFVLKDNSMDSGRQMASFGERNEPDQIRWEQELAKSVSQDAQGTSMVGKKPSRIDRLMFEMLEGKYEAELNRGVVSRLVIQRNQTPVQLNTETFMKNYGSVLRNFDRYEVSLLDPLHENVILKNKNGENVGQFVIERDSLNRVVGIDVK